MQAQERAVALLELHAQLRGCRRCVAAGHISEAHPIFHGGAGARVMVVGQAPGISAAERPLPYSGATGRTLRGWLARAGFTAEDFHDPARFYLTSLTKCFPGRAPSGAGDRVPSRREIALCSGYLAAELRLVRPQLVLALGRLAATALLPSLRQRTLAELVGDGREIEWPEALPGTIVLPLPHPSGVSRWHNDPTNRARLEAALAWLAAARQRQDW